MLSTKESLLAFLTLQKFSHERLTPKKVSKKSKKFRVISRGGTRIQYLKDANIANLQREIAELKIKLAMMNTGTPNVVDMGIVKSKLDEQLLRLAKLEENQGVKIQNVTHIHETPKIQSRNAGIHPIHDRTMTDFKIPRSILSYIEEEEKTPYSLASQGKIEEFSSVSENYKPTPKSISEFVEQIITHPELHNSKQIEKTIESQEIQELINNDIASQERDKMIEIEKLKRLPTTNEKIISKMSNLKPKKLYNI